MNQLARPHRVRSEVIGSDGRTAGFFIGVRAGAGSDSPSAYSGAPSGSGRLALGRSAGAALIASSCDEPLTPAGSSTCLRDSRASSTKTSAIRSPIGVRTSNPSRPPAHPTCCTSCGTTPAFLRSIRLADRGLRYTQFHTTALCSPSRVAMLTGRNHTTVGMAFIGEATTGVPEFQRSHPVRNGDHL